MQIFLKKDVEAIKAASSSNTLNRHLGAWDLVIIGLGAIVGAGAFVVTGPVAANFAGPAVTLSYFIAGVVCIFVALSYAELAIMLPTAGSVYSYSYVAYGQLCAWVMGGIMFLEMGCGAAAVAVGWSSYLQGILSQAGVHLPKYLTVGPSQGGLCDLLAVVISCFSALVIFLGTKDSKRLNTALVVIKFAAITAFVVMAAPHVDTENWSNFMPHGFNNVLRGSSILFFSFSGFGVIAAAAEECKNPSRDITIGVVGALLLSTAVYVVLGGMVTAIAPYYTLDNAEPLAYALQRNGSKVGAIVVAIGAIAGMTTVLMMQIYGLSRIVYVIARDRLLPDWLVEVHSKYGSPYKTIFALGLMISLLAGLAPFQLLNELASMAGLLDYALVVSIVLYLRWARPEIPREFKCPAVFVVAPIAIAACTYLLAKQMFNDEWQLVRPGIIILAWVLLTKVLYFIKADKPTS